MSRCRIHGADVTRAIENEAVHLARPLGNGGTCLALSDDGKQHECTMFGIPRRYSHFVFGVIQSGLTSLIAAGIASFPAASALLFVQHWMVSWLIAWVAMLPIVLLAAPAIRAFSLRLTREEGSA